MHSISPQLQVPGIENIYDTYSPMLYCIALELTTKKKDAEQILISTFQKIHHQNFIQKKHVSLCIALIKLTVETARELEEKKIITLNQMVSKDILHKVLFQNHSLESICEQNNLTRPVALKKIATEITAIRNNRKENRFVFKEIFNPFNKQLAILFSAH